MNTFLLLVPFLCSIVPALIVAQTPMNNRSRTLEEIQRKLLEAGFEGLHSHAILTRLTTDAPMRMSGSAGYRKAAELTKKMMEEYGFENVHFQPVQVPVWERGETEEAVLLRSDGKEEISFSVCALGGSVSTPSGGITGEVVEVKSFEELKALGSAAKGRIIFFNRPMDPTKLVTRDAYRGAVNQRNLGAIEAAKAGGIGVVVRSMTLALDDVPHAGAVNYAEGVTKIPAVAISTEGADRLSARVQENRNRSLRLRLSCEDKGEVQSVNVIGEIRGTEKPNDIILIGAHLDAWDKGTGAHDDGAGCAQVIEALNLIKTVGKPRRTIRVILFENEEMGVRGGKAYRDFMKQGNENHLAAIESDHGGFAPRGFAYEGKSPVVDHVLAMRHLFEQIDAGRFVKDHPGVDLTPIIETGVPGFGLDPENHRYFDYHHSGNDTIEKVHPRELELGAVAIAMLAYTISEMEEGMQ